MIKKNSHILIQSIKPYRFGGRIDSFRTFLEHAGVVYNPNVEPTFQYAHTQHLPLFDPDQASQSTATNTEEDDDIEPTTMLDHNGNTIDFDEMSDGSDH